VVLNDDFAVAVDAVESFIDEARQQHSRS
jgi:hypothetical protein